MKGAIFMSWKKMIGWILGIVIGGGVIVASLAFYVFIVLGNLDKGKSIVKKPDNESSVVEASANESEDVDKKVVNEPVDKAVVKLADGTDGHSFISKYHEFYNDTLCWGRIDTASYSEQAQTAREILQSLEGVKITNKDIAKDFESIKENAKIVVKEDNREAMRQLHRLFHDLDIYFNGYDYYQTFGVTEFTGE
jgi:hypothetical protein